MHDPVYNSYRRTYGSFKNEGYHAYTVQYYPNPSYFPAFLAIGPIVGCVVTLVVFLIVAILFVAYNVDMNRQLLHKQNALDSKRAFVRFISHEIRTPMNTVCMGLKVLQDEAQTAMLNFMSKLETAMRALRLLVRKGEDEKLDEGEVAAKEMKEAPTSALLERVSRWTDLMLEIEESADNAVGVLNEFLNYDKIEMKTLKIDKEILPVWSLISSSIKPFHIQAKEKGLQMAMHMDVDQKPSSKEPHAESPVLGTDSKKSPQGLLLIGDSLRLAQVFRNVVSNALKFSFRGTTVEIHARWHPDRLLDAGNGLNE